MKFSEQNEYYVVKGWFDKTAGMHQGSFYGAMATPDDYLKPRRVVVSGDGAAAASESAAKQSAKVFPQELMEHDAGGLNPKERSDTGHMLLDQEELASGSTGMYRVGKSSVPVKITGRTMVKGTEYWEGVDTSSHRKVVIYTPENFTPDKTNVSEMTGSGGIAMGNYALGVQSSTNTSRLGMSDRGGHGDIKNKSRGKRIKPGSNIKGSGRKMRGIGDKSTMSTISQSGGRRGGNKH